MKKILTMIISCLLLGEFESSFGQPTRQSMPQVTGVKVIYCSDSSKTPTHKVVTYSNESFFSKIGDTQKAKQVFDYSKSRVRKLTNHYDTDTICTWGCYLYKVRYKRAFYNLWITYDIGFDGSPTLDFGKIKGLVLKVVKNNEVIYEALSIERLTDQSKVEFN